MSFEHFGDSAAGVRESHSSTSELMERAFQHEARMAGNEASLNRMIDDIHPETPEDQELVARLKERAAELTGPRHDLRMAAQAAALSVALHGIIDHKEGVSSEVQEVQIAGILSKNPELAEMLVRGVLSAAQNLEAHTHVHTEGDSGSRLAEEAKEVLGEIEKSDKKLVQGLALRTAERVARAIVSASTLGIGAVVYDSLKDVYQSIRVHNDLRTKRKTLLMSSSALT